MTIDSDTKLETFDYNVPGWVYVYNKNIDLLNYALLKVNALLDVKTDNLEDKSILVWNASTSKWVCRKFE